MIYSIRMAPLFFLTFLLTACGQGHEAHEGEVEGHADSHGHHDPHGDDERDNARGQHGGRLLQQEGYVVELGIAETGRPPAFQAWFYRDDESLPADSGSIEVVTTRLGGVRDVHRLRAQADGSLLADSIVGEPHSFDVEVNASIEGKSLQWRYESYEGRTTIDADTADVAGIVVQAAAPGTIADEHEVQGLVTLSEGSSSRVAARYPGPVRAVAVNTGDVVASGALLAEIESNLSLRTYRLVAPRAGVIMARHASPGDFASEGEVLFEVASLDQPWVDLHLFGRDSAHVTAGMPVEVTRLADGATTSTTVERILPGMATSSQSAVARASIHNIDGAWRIGSAIKARITVEQKSVRLRVPLTALQQFRDWTVVFIRLGDTYEVRPLELGVRDRVNVEVIAGLEAGDQVVTEQSYLIKADIEKSGASHDH